MNLGLGEFLIIAMLAALVYCTVAGVIRAASNGDTAWVVGIIAGWLFGLGWLIGLVYLLAIAPTRARPSIGAPYAVPPPPPPVPAGWQPDPRGRHELRYWDGVQWTTNVSDAGVQSTDPVV